MWSTIYMSDFQNLKPTGDVWFKFDPEYDEELAMLEANTFHYDDGFTIGWYHNDVGLVTYVGEFETLAEVEAWYLKEGFEDFSS